GSRRNELAKVVGTFLQLSLITAGIARIYEAKAEADKAVNIIRVAGKGFAICLDRLLDIAGCKEHIGKVDESRILLSDIRFRSDIFRDELFSDHRQARIDLARKACDADEFLDLEE